MYWEADGAAGRRSCGTCAATNPAGTTAVRAAVKGTTAARAKVCAECGAGLGAAAAGWASATEDRITAGTAAVETAKLRRLGVLGAVAWRRASLSGEESRWTVMVGSSSLRGFQPRGRVSDRETLRLLSRPPQRVGDTHVSLVVDVT